MRVRKCANLCTNWWLFSVNHMSVNVTRVVIIMTLSTHIYPHTYTFCLFICLPAVKSVFEPVCVCVPVHASDI